MDEGDQVHGEDEELERHGDLVRNIGPQVNGQGEGGVRSLKQGDGEDRPFLSIFFKENFEFKWLRVLF